MPHAAKKYLDQPAIIAPTAKAHPRLIGADSAVRLGTIPSGCHPVFIHHRVIDAVLEFSDQDVDGEIGGFLLGGVFQDTAPYVEIMNFLPATGVSNSYRSLTFTHETWSKLHRQIADHHPDQQIVGWHHTHPGFGIFLSRHDLFIHRSFFDQPWQVALVVDPRQQELGLFQWDGDNIVNSGFLCIPRSRHRRRRKRA